MQYRHETGERCSKPDSYPIPRIDDCIDRIGQAKFAASLNFSRGVGSFNSPSASCESQVLLLQVELLKTFQRPSSHPTPHYSQYVETYINDVISMQWDEHVKRIRAFFGETHQVGCNFSFLGLWYDLQIVQPIQLKVEAISKFQVPLNKKELKKFLGMSGYSR